MSADRAVVRSCVLAGIALGLAHGAALSAGAHVHGKATLDVALEGDLLTLDFASPLESLVGFEHAPRNEQQRNAVRRMAARLREAEQLFVPTPEARCARDALTLSSPVLGPAATGAPGAAAKPAQPAPAHADLELTLVFRCAHPQKLAALDLMLFDAFPHVKRIEARVAARGRQAAAELTARRRRLAW